MDESAQNINSNNRNLFARNAPVALIVGVGSFLGSHLTEKLLEKNIQVLGVDDFKKGKREFLENASKNKNFHLINGTIEQINFNLERLDYLFIFPQKGLNIDPILRIFEDKKSRCLLISSIDLYNEKESKELGYLKQLEVRLAKFAHENHLNARVLRLGPVFGPRMDFKNPDPIGKLIKAALEGDLQKEINLDFSTKALYVDDAVELIVKSIMVGATALKIFDGSLPSPIKVSEIKQVLLDPVWYENKGFTPTELPPWTTPNLNKTINQLNWKPKIELVYGLKQTLNYFKDHGVAYEEKEAEEEDSKDLTPIFAPSQISKKKEREAEKPKKSHARISKIGNSVFVLIALGIILYALIWPVASLGWSVFSFKYHLTQASDKLQKGEFDQSLNEINLAQKGIGEAENLLTGLEPARKIGFIDNFLQPFDNIMNLAQLSSESAKSSILGVQALYQGLRAVTGEIADNPKKYFTEAQIELSKADSGFMKAKALTENEAYQKTIPPILRSRIFSLTEKLNGYESMVQRAQASAKLLPEIVGVDDSKSYLVLLLNNMELRPGGGFIGSFARVDFEGGKLKKLDVNDVYTLDGNLKDHVEPPPEIKNDLGANDWYLRDSNFEPDFPTSARQAEWFYNKEGGGRVEGVIALDVSAIGSLLEVVGPIDLADYNQIITAENLFEQTISHAEQGFFPGSQAKKTFLTTLSTQLLNKIFFLPKQNWPEIVTALGKSLENKDINIYLNDPKLFSYLTAQNWTGALKRNSTPPDGTVLDFLAPVEANLGGNKANYYIDRVYKLETGIGRDGEINQKLTINYTNRSPQNTWPGGLYKDRFRVYLPFGTKLNRVSWGDEDITKNVTSFVDYGRTGYSMLLELKAKEQKELVINYQLADKLKFVENQQAVSSGNEDKPLSSGNKAIYHLDVSKQAGTLKDPFEWKIDFPINYRIVSDENDNLGLAPQEKTITTDLSTDRSFELSFSKSL